MAQKKLMLLGGLRYLLSVKRAAHKMGNSVICLPMHHALTEDDLERVLDCVVK